MRGLLILIFAMSIGWVARADDKPTKAEEHATEPETKEPTKAQMRPTSARKGPAVLDFEGDVIEGERKSPNLFLQMAVDTPNLDVLLYQRKDFNDFHNLEKNRRPIYRKGSQ